MISARVAVHAEHDYDVVVGRGLDDEVLAGLPILAPGFGAQGAVPADLPRLFGALAGQVLASESRSVLTGGATGLADRIDRAAAAYREVRRG